MIKYGSLGVKLAHNRVSDGAGLRRVPILLVFLAASFHPGGANAEQEAVPGYSTDVRSAVQDILSYKPQVRISTAGVKEIELGRLLFFDPRLSRNDTVSCATCHQPALFWTDGLPRAKGIGGKEGRRNTPSLLTAGYYLRLGWDGKADSFERSALRAIEGSNEMDQTLERLSAKLMRVPAYAKAFAELYGSGSSELRNILKALAAFVSTLQAPENSPFDQFIKEGKGLSESAKRGLVVYAGKGGCRNCHSSLTFTDNRYRNLGVAPAAPPDPGRFAIDPKSENWGAFRTPTLRNAALTAPYMHDGSLATLKEVIEFYDRAGPKRDRDADMRQALGLTAQEKGDLLEFLKSLTSSVPAGAASAPPALDPGAVADIGDRSGRPDAAETALAPAPAALTAEADALLATASLLASELEALRASAGGGRRGIGSGRSAADDGRYADPDRAKAYCLKSPLALRAVPRTDMKMYQACKALEAGDPEVCRRSRQSLNDKDDCLTIFWNLKFARSLMTSDPDGLAVCRQWAAFESYNIDAVVLEAGCEGLQGTGAVEPLCRGLLERFPRGFSSLPECLTELGAVKGEGCSQYPAVNYRGQVCRSIAAYRESFREAAASRCGDRYVCRSLMGEAGVCDAEMDRWKARACGGAGGAATGAWPRATQPWAGLWSLMESAVLRAGDLVLEPDERAAVERLHAILLGRSPMSRDNAAADAFLVDSGQLAQALVRVEALIQEVGPQRPDWKPRRDEAALLRKRLGMTLR